MAYSEPAVVTVESVFPVAESNYIGVAKPTGVAQTSTPGVMAFSDPDILSVAFSGFREPTFFDDLYFKIHFTPGKVDLGNVLSAQTQEVRVWNAFLSDKTMSSYLEPSAQGINVTEPVSTPYVMTALEELSYTVTVSTDGPPQFSEQIVWTIEGVEYAVPVTGQRVVVWPFGPNWDQPLNESLEWKTDIVTSYDGTEERRSLRSKPRRRINYRLTLHGNELNQFQNLLFGWQDRQYAMPVWQDKALIADMVAAGETVIPVATAVRSFFKGGLAILIKDTYTFEVFEIAEVHDDSLVTVEPLEFTWNARTRLYPVNLGTLPSSIPTQRLTSKVMIGQIEFMADPVKTDPFIPDEPAVESMDGYELVYRKPNWSSPVGYDMESDSVLLDYESGAVQKVQKPAFPRQTRRVRWLLKSKADIASFRAFLGRMKGRYTPAYVPTWFGDFEVTGVSGLGSFAITVRRSQYGSMVGVATTQFAVLIRMRDGRKIVRKITGVSSPNQESEMLNIDEQLPFEVNPTNTLMVSLIHLCRLAQDGVTINYQSDSVSTVEMTMVTVKA